jgi:hypothetical protein
MWLRIGPNIMPQPQHEIVIHKMQDVQEVLIFWFFETFALNIKERIGSVAVCVVTGLLVGFCDFTRSIADSV